MTYVIMTEAGPVDEALLDGYGFGDRLLEGVMFRITIVEGAINCPGFHADSQHYLDRFTLEQVAQWQLDAERDCKDCGDNLTTADGQDAWVELVESDPNDPLAAVRESEDEDLANDFVDSSALLRAMGKEPRELRTVRPIEAESFGDISKRIVGTLRAKKTG